MVLTRKHMHSTNLLSFFKVLYNFTTIFVQEIN